MFRAERLELPAFLVRHIDRQNAVHTDLLQLRRERLQTVIHHDVEITEQDQPGIGVSRADALRHCEDFFQRDAVFQGNLRCFLDHDAVRDRIGKRHTEFNDVGSRFDAFSDQFLTAFFIGKTATVEDDQRLAFFIPALPEYFLNSVHVICLSH